MLMVHHLCAGRWQLLVPRGVMLVVASTSMGVRVRGGRGLMYAFLLRASRAGLVAQ